MDNLFIRLSLRGWRSCDSLPSVKRKNLKLAGKLHSAFKSAASKLGLSMNDATDEAVADWIAKKKKK